MSSVYEKLAENFGRWDTRGRGGLLHDAPVSLAPPFAPFPGHRLQAEKPMDDGSRPTIFSRLAGRIAQSVRPPKSLELTAPAAEPAEAEPNWTEEEEYREIQLLLPEAAKVDANAFAHFLLGVSLCRGPLVFEIVGDARRVVCQLCATEDDAPMVQRQLQAHFPDVSVLVADKHLHKAWLSDEEAEHVELELGLARPFMLPLADARSDLFVGLVGALSNLAPGEVGVYQVLFSPLMEPWAENAVAAVTGSQAELIFDGLPRWQKLAADKTAQPLYGAVVRLASRAADMDRVWEIIREMAAPFREFSRPDGNELEPLPNTGYSHEDHEMDLLLRQSRRSGMILNLDELMGFVHLPSPTVRSARFARVAGSTRAAETAAAKGGVCLGVNHHAGVEREVWLTSEQRVRHTHCIGGTGSGKSTLLFNLILQDIANGEGLAVIEPHGDLIDRVLGALPPERVNDVVLIDPSDEGFVVPFNVLSAHSDFEKTILASDLVSVFRMQSTSWGDQMQSVMQNAVLVFLESTEGGTLADMRRFLLDAAWRERFLQTVADPEMRFYWKRGFPRLGGGKSIGPILTRLETFLSPKPIRQMVSQKENRLDFADIMDNGKILLVRLPLGQMGRDNAFLLGSLIMAKLQQTIMSRQRVEARSRQPFFIYVDECQQFLTPSMAEILSGARKYGVGMILAHQELRQLERDKEVSSALLANAFTRVVFRVGDADARLLAEGFAHFEAKDIQRLRIGEAICRIERADNDFNLVIPLAEEEDDALAIERRAAVIAASRAAYAIPRAEVEAELLRRLEADENSHAQARERTSRTRERVLDEVVAEPVVETAIKESSPPKTSEAAAITVPVKPMASEAARTTATAHDAASLPAIPYKGGQQHRIVQERIQAAAENRGFCVMSEMQVGTGMESVDVGMVRSDMKIACEVSVTTTIDHEVGNVRKCLLANFDLVAVVTANERRLAQIEAAVRGHLEEGQAAKVRYFTPEQMLMFIEQLPEPPPTAPTAPGTTETMRHGWKVRRKFTPLTPEERAMREAAAFRLLEEEMRQPPRS